MSELVVLTGTTLTEDRALDTTETIEETAIEIEIVAVAETDTAETESAEEVDHLTTDRAETTTTHIPPAATTELENVKSATAATDGTTGNGIATAVQEGEMTGETTDAETATCSTTDVVAAVGGVTAKTSVEREKTGTSSLLKPAAQRLPPLLRRSVNRPQT